MVTAMRHRGPNSFGVEDLGNCVLGHTRLSILDVSAAGNQPMQRDGVWIAYNGETYNFKEERGLLEGHGYRFVSSCDTEVLLAMYQHYGEGFVKRLRGMFAFALYDPRKDLLLCARDIFGIKPLYYCKLASGGFVFASEIKSMLASGLISREIDRTSLFSLLRKGSVSQPSTILRNVHSLLPGHVLRMESGRVRIYPYWTFEAALQKRNYSIRSYQDHLELGRSLLEESLRLQLVSDVPIGAFLSGGIDSSLLVALMVRHHGQVSTYSVGFEDGIRTDAPEETEDAEVVARHLKTNHHRIVITAQEAQAHLSEVASGLDHPSVDGVNSYFVSMVAAKELTVAISGTGGDELFAGYPWFRAMLEYAERPLLRRVGDKLKRRGFLDHFGSYYNIFGEEDAEWICGQNHPLPPSEDPLQGDDTLNRISALTLRGYTGNQLLPDIDAASMCHSLEVRVPFLDQVMLEYALSLPDEAKIGTGDSLAPPGSYRATGVKRILLDIGKDLLPSDFSHRPKRGFTLPFDAWLRGPFAGLCRDALSEETTRASGLFAASAPGRIYEEFLAGRRHWSAPWLLLMTNLWANSVLTDH